MKSFSDLRFFCEYIVKEYGSPDAASEDEKAEEFRDVYLHNLPPTIKTLKAVASACGINLDGMEADKMPKNLRGYHEVFDGRRNIYYKEGDSISGIENTILHEIREMMEPIFAGLYADYEPLRTLAVHLAANRFAASVLLPKDNFRAKAYETGLDVIALARFYSKSCSQVLLRMGEVLQGQLFFYGGLYESGSETESDWRVTYWTGSWNEDCPEANIHGIGTFFPRRGHSLIPGSLVDLAVKAGKTHFVRHVTVVDEVEDDGLTAIAQPSMSQRASDKVALVALLERDREKLKPQVERTRPVVIDNFHKHL